MAAPIGVTTNIGALRAEHYLAINSRNLQQSIARRASGKRLISAADDAAGVADSASIKAPIDGMRQAQRNANDAIALLQTAESAYQQIPDILSRMRELAVQAVSDTLTDTDRGDLDDEFQSLISEVDRVAPVTEYNGIELLDGTAGPSGTATFQVGTKNTANDRIQATLASTTTSNLPIDTLGVDTPANARVMIPALDTAFDTMASRRATLGSKVNHLQNAADALGQTVQNLSEVRAQTADVDVVVESATPVKSQVLMQAGVAMWAKANATPNFALPLLQRS